MREIFSFFQRVNSKVLYKDVVQRKNSETTHLVLESRTETGYDDEWKTDTKSRKLSLFHAK